MDKTFKILKIFGYCLILSTPKTLDIMTDNICGTIRDMMKDSSFFPNFLSGIKNFFKSKELYYKAKIDENFINREEILDNFNSLLNNYEKLLNDKLSIITRICKILNHVGPQYFYFLTVEFNDQKRLASRCISKQGLTFTSFEENVGRFSLRDFIKPYIIKGKKFSPKKLQHLLLTYYKINFENYTKLEIDNYLDLGFLQKIYSEEVKGENNTEDSFENKNAISIFKKYLMNYPKKIKNHEIFLKQPNFYFDYFMNVILFPTSNLIFKYIMKEDTNMAKIKFEIYNIIILFLECYKLFLCVILSDLIDQYEDEMKILINNFFSVVDKDVKLFIRERIEIVSLNLDYAKTPDFPFFDLKKLLTIFSEAIKNISYIDKIKESPKKISQNMDELDPFYQNFMKQVDIYEDLKSDFESDEMMMIWIFKSEEKAIKNSICLCLVKMFKEEEMDCLTPYIEKNLIIIEMICKIFKADPKHFQDFFTTYSKFINLLNNIVQKQLLYLTQPIVIEFNRLCTNYENSPYKYFVYLIEFLRLMCENHNPCYQTLLFRTIIFEKKISENDELEESKKNNTDYRRKKMEKLTFVDFICTYFIYEVNYNILNLKQKKKDLVSIFKHETNNYYDNIVKCFIDFLIEIIQGTFPFNFLNFNVLQFNFNSFFTKMIDNFSHISLGEEIEYILSQFMRFLIAYMEENENPIENKIEIIKKIFPKKMYNCFIYSVKKLYVKLFKPENLNDVLNKIKIEKDASLLFEEQYKTNPTMMEDPLFILSTNIFYFLKIACSFENHANENFIKILQELESDSKRINEKYLKEMVSNGEIFLFYDKIIKKIEINYQANQIDKDELKEYRTVFKNANMLKQYEDMKKISDIKPEMKVHNVIFLVHPHSLFITNVDTKKFKQDAPYDGFNTKLPYIIDMIPKYEDNVKLRKDLYIDWEFLYQLYNIDYSYCNNASHIISLVINLLLLLTLKLDPLPIGVKEVDIFVFILTLIHLIMILFFMTNYLYFEIFKLREYTHKREIKLSSWDIFNNYWSLITNVDCLPLIWNFIFGFFAILDEKNRWMYSFQLFSVLSIFPTMAIVITSVMIRSKQFLSTALLILIIILFFSSISFYMFKELYFSTELDENLCSSYLLCFLNMLNYGIRSGTIGDFSYIKALDDPFYWSYFLFGWIFFFTVMLIMINVVNGIIVDTFQQLREDHNKKVNDNLNICYICNLHRCKFEIEGQKFESHTDNEHSLTSYLHYLLKINLVDPQDLNSLDFYVLNAVKEKRFDFFPIEKSLKLDKS